MQNYFVYLIIFVAACFIGKRLLNAFRTGNTSCGSCSGCSHTGCSSFTPSRQPEKKHT